MGDDTTKALKGAIRVDEEELRGHVDEVVRSSVEETLNGLLDAEADALCRAQRYERTAERVDTRAGHYERRLETKAGEVTLQVPKLRKLPFETAIIERYRRSRGLGGRSAGGDVSSGGIGAAGGRHHRSLMGHAGQLRDGQPTQSEDLPSHRGVAQP